MSDPSASRRALGIRPHRVRWGLSRFPQPSDLGNSREGLDTLSPSEGEAGGGGRDSQGDVPGDQQQQRDQRGPRPAPTRRREKIGESQADRKVEIEGAPLDQGRPGVPATDHVEMGEPGQAGRQDDEILPAECQRKATDDADTQPWQPDR